MAHPGYSFFFQYFHDGIHRIFLNTEIAIPPSYWDKQRECIKASLPEEFGSHSLLNQEINRQIKLDQLALEDFQLEKAYAPDNHKQKAGFFLQLEEYVKSKDKKVKKATITVFNNMINHFEAFEQY